jgi:hypothetical protein
VQRGVKHAPLRCSAFSQHYKSIPPGIVIIDCADHRPHVGDPPRSAIGRPSIELEIQADIGVQFVPPNVERNGTLRTCYGTFDLARLGCLGGEG